MLFIYAVEPEMRGSGVGSAFLNALIQERADLDGMYAEVEMAELAKSEEEKRICEKRIAFYENLGFRRVEWLYYRIYGVQMHLFYSPMKDKAMPDALQAIEDAKVLYDGILRPWERYNLQTKAL